MKITIEIKTSKFATFIAFLKTLDYVSIITSEEDTIPKWHKKEVRKRLNDYNNNPEQAVDFDMAMNDIEKDL